MSARAARQQFFRAAARQEKLDAIATGHTADDVAETLLLRLARGSGATGLSGLRPVSAVAGVRYVRPLLDCTHGVLGGWLRRKRQAWREDASNRDLRIPRNLLRHRVIPWLEKHWSPSIRAGLAQSAAILRDEDALLEAMSENCGLRIADCGLRDAKGRARGGRSSGADSPARVFQSAIRNRQSAIPIALQRRLLHRWLLTHAGAAAAGFAEVEEIRRLLAEKKPWQVSLPGGVLVRGHEGWAELIASGGGPAAPRTGMPARRNARATLQQDAGRELRVPGETCVAGVHVTARLTLGIVRTAGPVGALPSACSLDAAALRGKTLQVRTRRPGDRIRPLGMDGSKTLQDLFVDAKVPAEQRDRLPLLVVDGEVAWVPGYRVARAYAVRGSRAKAVKVEMRVIGR